MLSLITLPTPTEIVSSSTTWTTTFLPEFWVLVYAGIGILVFGLVVRWIMKNLKGGVRSAFGMGRGFKKKRKY